MKQTLSSNLLVTDRKLLFIIASILGYSFWLLLSSSFTITLDKTIPIYFYNNKNMIINGPETIKITLAGKRFEIATLDMDNLAAHINADIFKSGINKLVITERDLFLPKSIKLIHYNPANSTINIVKNIVENIDS